MGHDPHRHGRFTAIVDRRENGLYRTEATDVLFAILTINYSVPDMMMSIPRWLCFKRYKKSVKPA